MNTSVQTQLIDLPVLKENHVELHLLRLDQLHPIISGNKWFKLKYNIQQAIEQNIDTLISFGGAHSNHLAAFSYACKINGFKSVVVIRGIFNEQEYSPTIRFLKENNSILEFVTRQVYKEKNELHFINQLLKKYTNALIIPEGGNNYLGIKGASDIGNLITQNYHYVCVPVGTGATFKGLLLNNNAYYSAVIGFSSLKGTDSLTPEVEKLVSSNKSMRTYQIIGDYNFGGFGKYNQKLLQFIEWFYYRTAIELDMVYTAKMMYGILDRVEKGFFKKHTKIVAIHTGGLQGNFNLKERGLLKLP